jgi:hypothetical protein
MYVELCGSGDMAGGRAEGGVLACGRVCGVVGIELEGAAMPVMAAALNSRPDRTGRYLM